MTYGQKDLDEQWRFIPRVRFPNGRNIDLNALQSALQEQCDANGIPVAFMADTLQTGSLFNKQSENVLTLYNPNHPSDYLKFLLRITHQGNYAFLDVFKAGSSKNYGNANAAANSGMRKLLNMATGHDAKLKEEEDYYTILQDCFQNCYS